MAEREFEIIVYGATGFTGRLVAEYLAANYRQVKWAMAGRSLTKLEEVRDEIGAPADTPLLTANADDPAALKAMTARAQVVITTVGPYQLYGEPLLAACVETGTAYVDLCGEPNFMHEMIGKYQDAAQGERRADRLLVRVRFDPFRSWRMDRRAGGDREVRQARATREGPRPRDEGHLLGRHLRQRQGDRRRGDEGSRRCSRR